MELTLPFYELGELQTESFAAAASEDLLGHLRSDALCFLTHGSLQSGRVWDYHFVAVTTVLPDPSVIQEALNILEGRVYHQDAAALFLPPAALPAEARRALIRTLELGAVLSTTSAQARLQLQETTLAITTCRVSRVDAIQGEREI